MTDREGNAVEREDDFEVKVNQDSPRKAPGDAHDVEPDTTRRRRGHALRHGVVRPEGRIVDYEWHLWSDVIPTTEPTLKYTFQEPRENNALLKVTDDDGLYDEAIVPYRVGDEGENTPLAA